MTTASETGQSTPTEPSVGTPSSASASPSPNSAESFIDVDINITEAMRLEEEESLKTEASENEQAKNVKQRDQARTEYNNDVASQRSKRLSYLIEKSLMYANFLEAKMQKQREEAIEKANRKEDKKKEAKRLLPKEKESTGEKESDDVATGTRASTRRPANPDEHVAAAAAKKKNPGVAKKRKVDEAHYDIVDYIDKDALKKQKQMDTGKPDVKPEVEQLTSAEKSSQPAISPRQPKLVTGGVLRDYQLDGVQWLISLFENGLNGILADEMGLGKTLQTISFLAHLRANNVWGPFLIVAPLSTLANWVMEFEKFVPDIPVELYHGSQEEREHKRNHKMRKLGPTFPVIVTSYEIVIRDRKFLSRYKWKYIIVDEGHRLKNMNCRLIRELKTYDSANRLLLTGTPLQNNLSELWSLLNFLLPDIFDDRDGFEEWFDFSDINAKEGQERILGEESQSGIVTSLHAILKPFLLRRIKTDVEHSLPKKKEYLLYAPLTPTQKEWYDAALGRDIRNFLIQKKCGLDTAKAEGSEETDDITLEDLDDIVNAEEQELEKLTEGERKEKKVEAIGRRTRGAIKSYAEQSDAQYFKDLEEGKETKQREEPEVLTALEVDIRKANKSITNMKLKNVVMQLRKVCNHPFLFDWPMDPKTNQPVLTEELLTASGKMLVLNRLLDALFARDHKVLIFSQFTTMLDIIQDWAELHKKWTCCRIDGAVAQEDRRRQISEFNRDKDLKLFLLSTRAGGLGINLTSADTVIIFDSDWNPQMDLQAQDRVHRIGQTRPVMIYRLVTANTIENKIIERASSKRKLEKLVIHKGKFKQSPPSSTGAAADRAATLADLAEMLAQDDGEKIQLATKDDVVISDKHLAMLLDRSDAAYETNGVATAEDDEEAGASIFKAVEAAGEDQNDFLKVDKMASV